MAKITKSIQIRGDEDASDRVARLFGCDFYAEFQRKFTDPANATYKNEDLQNTLISASDHYIWASVDYENQVPEGLENAALERVNKSIWELYNSLIDLMDAGKADKKLTAEIRSYANAQPGTPRRILAELLKKQQNQSAFYFREMLMDLLDASERAQNIHGNFENDPTGVIWLNIDEKKAIEKERWQKRRAESRLSKSSPLLSFLSDWKPFWETYSHIPFTEGRYVKELGTTKSQAVDALEGVFALLDTSVTRSAIVSAVKKAKQQ